MNEEINKSRQVKAINDIDAYRTSLVTFMLSPESRYAVRPVVIIRQLMSEIQASRSLDIPWENIARQLQLKGLKLSAGSIRKYYLDEVERQSDDVKRMAQKYKHAAEEAALRFYAVDSKKLDNLVKESLDRAIANLRPGWVAPVSASADTSSAATTVTAQGVKPKAKTAAVLPARAASPPPEVRAPAPLPTMPTSPVTRITPEQFDQLLADNSIDFSNIPDRPFDDD